VLRVMLSETRVACVGATAAFVQTSARSGHRTWVKVPISAALRVRLKAKDPEVLDRINRVVDEALDRGQEVAPNWFAMGESS
jgi:hypothetical protein